MELRQTRFGWASPLLAGALLAGLLASVASADDLTTGKTSGLPLPRFVSLKSAPVNVRQGPSMEQNIAWKFLKPGIPVEVTQEFDIWFRIRDAEGQEGWVQKTLLSGKRTALVSPWDKGSPLTLFDRAAGNTRVALIEHNVIVDVGACDGKWCRISAEGTKGFIEQDKLWGVYPGEKVE
ncbi:MAG: SH3 domain-containing protein [Ancalomicrobiaceae bacterium]|nr:SH3 domain-containing protein [Ancalomicrobiaceae bacterium]